MKNSKLLTTILLLLALHTTGNAQRFNLWNISDSHADASIYFVYGCPKPMPFMGYLTAMSNDTFYVKALYRVTACYAYSQSHNRDTIYNIAFPAGANYINISKNTLSYRESSQTYDTTWNRKDSTFVLHPATINNAGNDMPRVKVYPNPARNTLFFEEGTEYKEVHVYNNIGLCVAICPYNKSKSIDIGALAEGLYFLKLTGNASSAGNDDGVTGWARFVKTAH